MKYRTVAALVMAAVILATGCESDPADTLHIAAGTAGAHDSLEAPATPDDDPPAVPDSSGATTHAGGAGSSRGTAGSYGEPARSPGEPGGVATAATATGRRSVVTPEVLAEVGPGSSDSPIGTIDTHQSAPAGTGLASRGTSTGARSGAGTSAASSYSAGYGCETSCITEGAAYARGFGAELVVRTSVPTTIWLAVVQVAPGSPLVATTNLSSADTEHSWAVDHLDPATSYRVTVVATDDDGNADHGHGEFTTLSTRTVSVQLDDVVITGGPSEITHTGIVLGLSGQNAVDLTPGQAGIPLFPSVARYVDVDLTVRRSLRTDHTCEVFPGPSGPGAVPDHGYSTTACIAWNTARIDDLDLDVAPAGASRWSATSFTRELRTPTGAGGALPPGYGDPYWFDVVTSATFHVTYS